MSRVTNPRLSATWPRRSGDKKMLTREMQQELLVIARGALEARVRGTQAPDIGPQQGSPRHGAFVTIFCSGDLRGCLGRVTSDWPLADLISHLAQEVADSDPRFTPVAAHELKDITIEVSVLTLEREIHSIDEIELGRHGLIIEHGSRKGLLLPQVPEEHDWDRETFVAQGCLKAGLPADAWRHGARLLVFEAQVFGEGES
jgi:AmmeMemoRadiSam system protein A